jgi:hypothetical protein
LSSHHHPPRSPAAPFLSVGVGLSPARHTVKVVPSRPVGIGREGGATAEEGTRSWSLTRSKRATQQQAKLCSVRPKSTLVFRSPRSGGMWFLASDVATQPVQSALGRGDLLCWLERSGAARRRAGSEHAQRRRRRAKNRHVWSGARVVSGTNGAGKMQDARRKTPRVLCHTLTSRCAKKRRRRRRGNDRECCRVGQASVSYAADTQVRRDRMRFNVARVVEGGGGGGWALWLPAQSARQSQRERCRLCASACDRSDAPVQC